MREKGLSRKVAFDVFHYPDLDSNVGDRTVMRS